ncbi:MAG: S41 family peptidase [Fusicatenibacter sp.]|nr:S41 family peptidase [Lachnospiraceae bacterium]MDY2937439.1 S41 family peptidase [Fusicatenibacter sp.]
MNELENQNEPEHKGKKRRFSGKKISSTKKAFFAGIAAALGVVALLFLLINFVWLPGSTSSPGSWLSAKKIRTIEELIDQVYAGDKEDEKLADSMYKGLISGLGDRYSTYYTASEYEAIKTAQDGYYEGIGVTVSMEEDHLIVEEVQQDTPAWNAGILPGDQIVRIDGNELTGMTLSEAVALLKENGKETVTLTISRESGENGTSEELLLEVKKEKLEAVSVAGEMLEDSIGYLAISEFTSLTAKQFGEVYENLKEQDMERLIVDLRGNPGGLVSSVCDTLRQILPEGLIVYTEDKNGKREEYLCDGDTPIDIPLVVLVNENTASAAEIFTGAVKDYGIGTIVGTVTFGKGIVQNTYKLPDGSVVKLTIAHYYTPLGNDIHGVGITPDVEIELPEDADSDVQLEKAIDVVKKM